MTEPITVADLDGPKKIFELVDGELIINGVSHGGGAHARLLLDLLAHPPAAGEMDMADDDDLVAKARQQGEAIAALRRDLEALARAHADLLAQMQKRPPR